MIRNLRNRVSGLGMWLKLFPCRLILEMLEQTQLLTDDTGKETSNQWWSSRSPATRDSLPGVQQPATGSNNHRQSSRGPATSDSLPGVQQPETVFPESSDQGRSSWDLVASDGLPGVQRPATGSNNQRQSSRGPATRDDLPGVQWSATVFLESSDQGWSSWSSEIKLYYETNVKGRRANGWLSAWLHHWAGGSNISWDLCLPWTFQIHEFCARLHLLLNVFIMNRNCVTERTHKHSEQ